MSELSKLAKDALSEMYKSADTGAVMHDFCLALTKDKKYVNLPLSRSANTPIRDVLPWLGQCFLVWQVEVYVLVFEAVGSIPNSTGRGLMVIGKGRKKKLSGYASIEEYGQEIAVSPLRIYDTKAVRINDDLYRLLPPSHVGPPPKAVKDTFYKHYPFLNIDEYEESTQPRTIGT